MQSISRFVIVKYFDTTTTTPANHAGADWVSLPGLPSRTARGPCAPDCSGLGVISHRTARCDRRFHLRWCSTLAVETLPYQSGTNGA